MLSTVKNFLKRFLPVPARTSNQMHHDLFSRIDALENLFIERVSEVEAQTKLISSLIDNQSAEMQAIKDSGSSNLSELALLKHKLNRLERLLCYLPSKQAKTIFAIACVKDESDVIESFCRYTLSYCDGLIIYDDGSTDGTKEIIQDIIKEGLNVYYQDDDILSDPSLAESFTRRKEAVLNSMAGMAFDEHNADLVVPLDADEFLMSLNEDNPRTELELLDDTIEYRIQWRTYIYQQEPNDNAKFLPLYFDEYRLPVYEDYYKTVISKHQYRHIGARVPLGQHCLEYPANTQNNANHRSIAVHDRLVLAHFPLRSIAQATKKITAFRKAHGSDSNLPDGAGWHLRKIYEQFQQHGSLENEQVREMSLMYAYNLAEGETIAGTVTETGVLRTSFCKPSLSLKYTDYARSSGCFTSAAELIRDALDAYEVLEDRRWLEEFYPKVMGKPLNLDNPQTFTEKMQWLKLYDRKPVYTQMTDKFEVRNFVRGVFRDRDIPAPKLIKLLGVWDKFDDINFETLPKQFVLKCNHDAASVLMCKNKDDFDINAARSHFNERLAINYYSHFKEWTYKYIKPQIIAEEYLPAAADADYKVWVFNGEPRYIQVMTGRFVGRRVNFYDEKWNLTDMMQTGFGLDKPYPIEKSRVIPKPVSFDYMMQCAKLLSEGMAYARIDFFIIDDELYFGEITFRPMAGYARYSGDWDRKLGDMIRLPILSNFVLNILNHCNLNCKGCDHFAPIAEPYFVSVESIRNDINRMSVLTNQTLKWISIMGGETLLHPHLPEILRTVREAFPTTILRIVTNGILLMKQEDVFWDACRENTVVVVATKYPINVDYDKIAETAKEQRVQFEYYKGTEVEKTAHKITMDIYGFQDAKHSFLSCHHAKSCTFVMEGKLYPCPIIPNAVYFNQKFDTHMELKDDDYLDIYAARNCEEIVSFLCTPKPFCRYCNTNRLYGIPWERSKQDINEWV